MAALLVFSSDSAVVVVVSSLIIFPSISPISFVNSAIYSSESSFIILAEINL
ncbi:MAG: hypothetical protein ACLTYM_03515 [Clostridia bacterium]